MRELLPASYAANLAIWVAIATSLAAWQTLCCRHHRLPSFGWILDLIGRWWLGRFVLLTGWFWLGWHFFVRGAW